MATDERHYELLITGGTVVDGTGGARFDAGLVALERVEGRIPPDNLMLRTVVSQMFLLPSSPEIMAEVKREAVRLGLTKLFAEVSITARHFFERQGFIWIRDNVAVIGGVELANFIMEWEVAGKESGEDHC